MANLSGYDANDYEPAGDYTPIPEADYLAIIINSEMKPTKAGTGKYLELVYEILEGEHKGRQQWSRHNLENPNPQAVKIAKGELSSICRAVGVMKPNDSIELHKLPLIIKVKLKKREDNGELTNEIKGWYSKDKILNSCFIKNKENPSTMEVLKETLDKKPEPEAETVPPWKRNRS